MRLLSSIAAAVVLGILTLAACNSNDSKGNRAAGSTGSTSSGTVTSTPTSSQSIAPSDGIKRVTTVELRDALDKGAALVVDVRSLESYRQSHIKGSISMPLEQVTARTSELPRDKMIVTYCS